MKIIPSEVIIRYNKFKKRTKKGKISVLRHVFIDIFFMYIVKEVIISQTLEGFVIIKKITIW